ncbi:MAG: DUF1961 family protein [Planctomycetes bacterium]|nr:DUF1961 family protein [Planctomycetota bacterium]
MRTIELPDRQVKVETLYEDDFSAPNDDWLPEGGAEIRLADGRLFMDAREAEGREHPYLTLWCRKPFAGDTVIEYTARVEDTPDGSTNLNFFVYASHLDGSSVIDTTAERTGDYPEYHVFNNYIYTYLNGTAEGGPRTRVRYRKDPGFNLVKEAWREPIVKGRDYDFLIAVQGPRMRFYVDNELIIDHDDAGSPHRQGHHGFRTWHTFMSAAGFRISSIQ